MTGRTPAFEPFDALLGTWDIEATHPAVDAVAIGTVTFEWLHRDDFLLVRSSTDHAAFPDSLWVIGATEAADGLVMEYFDVRGVRRTYDVALDDGVLRSWRDAPGFDQRFSATLGSDSFAGVWQLARQRDAWVDDLEVVYRRRTGTA